MIGNPPWETAFVILQVCDMLIEGAAYIWDDEMKVPYLVQGDQWVGFDDERSIRNKMDWVKENGYAGAMVWTVDMDDFNGTVCGSGVKYPLIGAMREELLGKGRFPIEMKCKIRYLIL